MVFTMRPYIAVLMSLLLLASATASAVSVVYNQTSGAGAPDCVTAMANSTGAGISDHQVINHNPCSPVSGTVCLSSGSMNQCVVLFALGSSHILLAPDLTAQSDANRPDVNYQNPYLEIVTPPPEIRA